MPEDQQQQQFNTDALAGMIGQGIKAAFAERDQAAATRAQAAAAARQTQAAASQVWEDPVGRTVLGNPAVQGVVRDLALQNELNKDYSRFYLKHPDALKDEQEIERRVNHTLQQGRPMDRETVWYHYKGINEEQRFQERMQQIEQERQYAAQGITVGPGGLARPEQRREIRFDATTPLDEMRKQLQGVSF